MTDHIIVRHCSPTLAGMKTGSLFACSFAGDQEMRGCIRCWNRTLVGKGLRVVPLRFRNGRALVYVFRISQLSRDLQHDGAKRLLHARGYDCGSAERCILRLIERIGDETDFPHEIELFLGYPPEDVHGFIEHRAEGCKCVGCWRVYGDANAAQKLFAQYKQCTRRYCEQFENGMSIERLTVAG